jgi:GTPase SAR1 family protein
MLVCPYCYNDFVEKEIQFRCSGRPGSGERACPVGRDEHLMTWLGYATPLPPAFSADGRKLQARCPDCKGDTTRRLCPHCHSRLPVHFGKVDGRLIAMIGAKQSGKTVFMTVLIHELMHRIGRVLDAAIVGSDDETRRSFDRDYDQRLYQEHSLPDTTRPVAARAQRRPLVFRLTLQQRRLARFSSAREKHTILSFFDTAGEDLTTSESVDLNVRYLSNADGIILLLDPLQMPGARVQALPDTILPDDSGGFERPLNVLTRVTELLREKLSDPTQKIRTPVAVVFSKLDALEHTFSPGTALTRVPALGAQFDTAGSLAVHRQVQALLDDWDGPLIDQLMRHNYEHFRYFGVSALGGLPVDPRTVGEIRPHRVHDPFFWLLSRFGTIAAGRG